MHVQHLIAALSGAGGGGGGASVTMRESVQVGTDGYRQANGVEVGDLLIFGRNYRGSGTQTPGQPTLTGTTGTVTTVTANLRYDTGGVSDGGYSLYWALATEAGDIVASAGTNSNTFLYAFPTYDTVVQTAITAVNADTTPSASLSSEPTNPVFALIIGGGGVDTTSPSDVTDTYANVHEQFNGGRYVHSYTGSGQDFAAVVTATQVAAGGSGVAMLELGNT